MRHTLLLGRIAAIIACLLISYPILSQEFSNKYGKVTNDELTMTSYENDTTANAVVIFKKGTTMYEYINNDFRVEYQVEVKIKVLKHEGTEYANVTIPYYNNDKNSSRKETVIGLDASAYNMEDGKMVRTKMKKEYVFKERLNDNYMQMKFSIPAVKVGTVIEYKYKLLSDLYYQLESWPMQQEIPVVYNNYELSIPEYFKFNFDMRGGEKVDVKEGGATQSLTVTYSGGSQTIQCQTRKLTFTGNHMPALKPDSYVWYPDDYTSQIHFELNGLDFPGMPYHSFTSNWEKIDQLLLDDEDFGKLVKMRNPLRDEMKELSLEGLSTNDKIAYLFTFLKKRISWNEEYALFGRDIRKAIKEGTANNAVLNFILISMLREANIPAYPVIMSRRDRGILPYAYPSINKINTFIVGIANSDSTLVFLDGSVNDGYINTLPPVLLTQRARIVSESRGEKWVTPMNIGKSDSKTLIQATVTPDGEITGSRESLLTGQYASVFRKTYRAAKDSLDFIEKKETNNNIKIQSYSQQGIGLFSPEATEKYTFTKTLDTTDEYIYISPIIFKHTSENPFTQETRKLPVEFPYKQNFRLIVSIKIPDGYVVDELPKAANITMADNKGLCRYIISQANNTISLNYHFILNSTLFAIGDYKELKDFMDIVAEKNNELVVLKKVSQ